MKSRQKTSAFPNIGGLSFVIGIAIIVLICIVSQHNSEEKQAGDAQYIQAVIEKAETTCYWEMDEYLDGDLLHYCDVVETYLSGSNEYSADEVEEAFYALRYYVEGTQEVVAKMSNGEIWIDTDGLK